LCTGWLEKISEIPYDLLLDITLEMKNKWMLRPGTRSARSLSTPAMPFEIMIPVHSWFNALALLYGRTRHLRDLEGTSTSLFKSVFIHIGQVMQCSFVAVSLLWNLLLENWLTLVDDEQSPEPIPVFGRVEYIFQDEYVLIFQFYFYFLLNNS